VGITLSATWLLLAAAVGAEDAKQLPSDEKIQAVIDQVEEACRQGPVFMIGPAKARRLAELVREAKPKVVLEGGTALGYSGLWIARELKNLGRGKLVTMEISPERAKQAEENFRRAGLAEYVEVRVGDAKELAKKVKGPIDFAFIDCGYSNYLPIFKTIEAKLTPGATVVADNVGIGSGGMKDYLSAVRTEYDSRTEWFELELPWAKRDAMEVTIIRRERGAFLGWAEDKARKVGDEAPQSPAAWLEIVTTVKPSTYEEYNDRKRKGRITVESFREGHVYYAIQTDRDVPFPPSEDGPVSAWFFVTERYKAKLPSPER
jgi:predicted O-methyltransferase YrrM